MNGDDWHRATRWVDGYWGRICPPLDRERPEAPVHQLHDAVNLTLVVSTVLSLTGPDDAVVGPWLRAATGRLVRYFGDVEPVLRGHDREAGAPDELAAIPLFLLEGADGVRFQLTEELRQRLPPATSPGGHDHLLLAALAGRAEAAGHLADRLAATRRETAEGGRKSRLYDLTHEILYLHLVAPERLPTDALVDQLEALVGTTMPVDADLGAELLAAYWALGGPATGTIAEAVGHLHGAGDVLGAKQDEGGCCGCSFKEQVHNRLTLVLGVGATLATLGEQPADTLGALRG